MWTNGHSGGHMRRAPHGYEPTREATKSWRRECPPRMFKAGIT
jgi:hypothetical protein